MAHDYDPQETQEWLDAWQSVLHAAGKERAEYLLGKLHNFAYQTGCLPRPPFNTPYKNTLAVIQQEACPGDQDIEARLQALVRWNAAVMVVRAGKRDPDLGGHIGTFASAATLYEVGFNHFWRAATSEHGGDLLFVQGHSSPGIYARSYLEGVISEDRLENFRQEVDGQGLSSYPHPWLMPEYWQFPTVSMGLGPIQAIYQARFMRYLQNRGLKNTDDRKVWCFCGDGEMDEPESTGVLRVAAQESLDNLIFVVNCNLQRLDGPVRGNGKIIQELEALFIGAGWNVIKVVWGSNWDSLLAQDKDGLLQKLMEETVDGEYQNCAAKGGAYLREHFFGKYPELKERVAHLSDVELGALQRGGHCVEKVFAAYHAAVRHKNQPTVILAKTVKGFGLGTAGEALNTAHNAKKMASEELKIFRDRFHLPISDEAALNATFYHPGPDSVEVQYLKKKRLALGGSLPKRRQEADETLTMPELSAFAPLLQASGERSFSTTMAFVRLLTILCKDEQIGKRVVPIVPDEARTFGMEGLFRQFGIYSPKGQTYQPVDADQIMYYKEATDGQILQEGLNEPGAFSAWLAASTAYSTHNLTMLPFYIYYSMFGFQRIGDLAWAAGDSRARGFLIGATAGRTTLNGEGLQHEDGHSHILANTIPNCRTYDPTYAYELAVIIQDGLKRMYQDKEAVFYYITVMNENYTHPEMPSDPKIVAGIIKGMYRLKASALAKAKKTVELMGSGTILREVEAAALILENDYQVAANVWSVTSFNELGREGLEFERWNRLHPLAKAKIPFVTECLQDLTAPIIAATDYMKSYAEQLRPYIKQPFYVLGTNGYGRSDSRKKLRDFFEVDRHHIVVTALKALADAKVIDVDVVVKAMKKYHIDSEKPSPETL